MDYRKITAMTTGVRGKHILDSDIAIPRNKLRYDIEYDGMAISLSNICFPLTPVVKAVNFL
jgi:hypothetical protein